jgi:Phosphomannomutase
VPVAQLGEVHQAEGLLEHHIETILAHPLVNTEAIRTAKFRVGVDAVNSSGGVALPALLERLGVAHVECINCEPNGVFAHNPEPLAIHLMETCARVRDSKLDLCLVVDPDVDRLALIDEKGQMIGEEYTLVGVADYVLGKTPGPVVNNLSSSRALYDIAQQHGVKCTSAAVGEVNVVAEMKAQKAVLGGEGNGGVIVPDLHYGRDALIGAALFLALLAERQKPLSELRATWPSYFMAKGKIPLNPQLDFDRPPKS